MYDQSRTLEPDYQWRPDGDSGGCHLGAVDRPPRAPVDARGRVGAKGGRARRSCATGGGTMAVVEADGWLGGRGGYRRGTRDARSDASGGGGGRIPRRTPAAPIAAGRRTRPRERGRARTAHARAGGGAGAASGRARGGTGRPARPADHRGRTSQLAPHASARATTGARRGGRCLQPQASLKSSG